MTTSPQTLPFDAAPFPDYRGEAIDTSAETAIANRERRPRHREMVLAALIEAGPHRTQRFRACGEGRPAADELRSPTWRSGEARQGPGARRRATPEPDRIALAGVGGDMTFGRRLTLTLHFAFGKQDHYPWEAVRYARSLLKANP